MMTNGSRFRNPAVRPRQDVHTGCARARWFLSFVAGCAGLAACGDPGAGHLPPLPPRLEAEQEIPGPAAPPRRLVLALVAEVRGEVQPCGCPTAPLGGFERRAGALAEVPRGEGPLFHLDAGNLLVRGYATGGRGEAPERARLLLDLSDEVGVDAWCPGPGDLAALPLPDLQAALAGRSLVATSATWTDAAGAALFPPAVVLERGGLRLGVVGLSAAPGDPAHRATIQFLDPVEAANRALDTLPPGLDLVVGLSNLPDGENDRVAREVPGLAAVLSTRNVAFDPPRQAGAGVVVEVPDRGRYLTLVHARLASDAHSVLDLEGGTRLGLRTRDQEALRVRRLAAAPEAPLLADARRRLDALDAALLAQGAGRNLAWDEVIPLGDRFGGDPGVEARIRSFQDETLADLARELEAAAARPDAPPAYASSAGCFSCHQEQFTRWTLTRHARAWESLLVRKADADPECVTCHATGFGVPGGWTDIDPSRVRRFKAVQCEACHGPLEGHPDDGRVKPHMPTEATCRTCHDADNSPGFDLATYLPRGTCTLPEGDAVPDAAAATAPEPPPAP